MSSSLGPFAKLGLSKNVCKAVHKFGFTLPTPIQRKAIKTILTTDKDIVINSRTGSGKTFSFLLPIMHLLDSHNFLVGARSLILSPTRELAMQTGLLLYKLIKDISDLRICFLVGGSSIDKEINHLALNPDILIATPGRLVYHITTGKYGLGKVIYIVLDECDLLFEMNYETDLQIIRKNLTANGKRFILCGATITDNIASYSKFALSEPIIISLKNEEQLSELVNIDVFMIKENDKVAALIFWLFNILIPTEQAIIFCSTAHHVNYLSEILQLLKVQHTCITGSLDQEERNNAINLLRSKKCNILIATDVAARGLDIHRLGYVINYNFPASPKIFIHRCGRTARNNEVGTCISFITKTEIPYFVEFCLFTGIKLFNSSIINNIEIKDQVNIFDQVKGEKDNQDLEELPLNKTSNYSTNRFKIGSIPISILNEINNYVFPIIQTEPIRRLQNSMQAAEKVYNKFKQQASKMSIKRTHEILSYYGGLDTIYKTNHPSIPDNLIYDTQQVIEMKNAKSNDYLHNSMPLEEITNDEKITLDNLREFKVCDKNKIKSNTNIKGVKEKLQNKFDEAKKIQQLALTGLKYTNENIENKIEDNIEEQHQNNTDSIIHILLNNSTVNTLNTNNNNKKTSPYSIKIQQNLSRRQAEQNKLDAIYLKELTNNPTEAVKDLHNNLNYTNKNLSYGMLYLDEEDTLRKQMVRKWNKMKKRYEFVNIDHLGKVLKKKKITTQEKRRVNQKNIQLQKIGERESENIKQILDQNKHRNNYKLKAAHELEPIRYKISDITKNKGLVEKIQKGLKLTNKETRTYKKLQKKLAELNDQKPKKLTNKSKKTSK